MLPPRQKPVHMTTLVLGAATMVFSTTCVTGLSTTMVWPARTGFALDALGTGGTALALRSGRAGWPSRSLDVANFHFAAGDGQQATKQGASATDIPSARDLSHDVSLLQAPACTDSW